MKPQADFPCGHNQGPSTATSRRHFLKTALWGSVAAASGLAALKSRAAAEQTTPAAKISQPAIRSRVALTAGEDHANNMFKGMDAFREEIRKSIGNKRVVIKPNNVLIDNPLCATPAASIEGILEFLKSIGKTNVVIAESCASGDTLEGFSNYGYNPIASKYNAKLVDLDGQEFDVIQVFDENDFRPHPMRTSRWMLDRNNYIISAAKFKTHDRVLATLSLKNIVVGAPIKDKGFAWGHGQTGAKSDKSLAHGGGIRGINYNLFALAYQLRPDLAVIDGYEGMEGNGPAHGTAVHHRVAVVSPDWLAADRVAVELMGIEFAKIGYLNYCADAKMGEADLAKIEILGPSVKDHVKPYKLADNISQQLTWQTPAKETHPVSR
jgi:uncharacterized protein (DUF362 family)